MNKLVRDNWNSHWENLGNLKRLNPAQTYRHNLIIEVVRASLSKRQNLNIFDFGSGLGLLVKSLMKEFPNQKFTGLELSEVGVDSAKKNNHLATFRQCNLLNNTPPHEDLYEVADIGICCEVLEHLDEPDKLLTTVRLYLKPSAILIVSVPSGPMNNFEKIIGHRKHYKEYELKKLIESSGFNVLSVSKSGFPFFNLYKILAYMRGEKLNKESANKSNNIKILMNIFNLLFKKFNFKNSPWGWQLILVARKI